MRSVMYLELPSTPLIIHVTFHCRLPELIAGGPLFLFWFLIQKISWLWIHGNFVHRDVSHRGHSWNMCDSISLGGGPMRCGAHTVSQLQEQRYSYLTSNQVSRREGGSVTTVGDPETCSCFWGWFYRSAPETFRWMPVFTMWLLSRRHGALGDVVC